MNSRKTRRRLAPSERYELFVSVLTGQATQREAGEMWKVDRSTVVHICRTAKQGALDALSASVPGRPGMTAAGSDFRPWRSGPGSSQPRARAPGAPGTGEGNSPRSAVPYER